MHVEQLPNIEKFSTLEMHVNAKNLVKENRLLQLNEEGIIPGPQETEEDFLKRGEYCLELKNQLADLNKLVPQDFFQAESLPLELWTGVLRESKKLYGMTPHWIPLFFSNYKLAPWHGGCAWIFQLNDQTPISALFQLRAAFRHSISYMKLYDRDELMTHELAHVGRMMYHEPQFEEILAYRSAKSPFRRWFGPIVESSFESMFFVILLLIVIFFDFFLMWSANLNGIILSLWIKVLPLGVILYALGRLIWKQLALARCLQNLMKVTANEEKANSIIYRLTDEEIKKFSRFSDKEIKAYISENKEKSLRWQLISIAYLDLCNH